MLIGPLTVAIGTPLASAGYDIGGILIVLGLVVGMFVFLIGYRVLRGSIPVEDVPKTLWALFLAFVGIAIAAQFAPAR